MVMRNNRKFWGKAVFVCLVSAVFFWGYLSLESTQAAAFEPFLNYERLNLNVGDSFKLSLIMNTEQVEWYSKNEAVASVSRDGKVTGHAEGKTRIFAEVNGKKYRCIVTVRDSITIKLAAVGDALIHENILKSGQKSDGTYNYNYIFKNIKQYLKQFDVKIINQETIFVNDSSKYGGYPSFGTPVAVGDAMRDAGFNVITLATNHAYDRGMTGINNTISYWQKYSNEVLTTGIYNSQKAYDTLSIRDYDGIKIAFLNYTALVNSGSKREAYTIRFLNETGVIKEIKKAKKKADFVIVLPHWGVEYEHRPTDAQVTMAKKFAEAGADAIIGCHPHVVQPMKVIKTEDGRKVPCFYSLGNFTSNMFWFKCQLEGMAELTITKKGDKTELTGYKYTPLVNHINKNDTKFTTYLLEDYTEKIWPDHYMNIRHWMGLVSTERLWTLWNSLGNSKNKE